MSTEQKQSLYEADETAWLEETSALVRQGRWTEVDRENLSEYLWDMAQRDRREVTSRLTTLFVSLLRWVAQPELHTGPWRGSIMNQHLELELLLDSETLRRHGEQVFDKAYQRSLKQAAAETGLDTAAFPANSPWSLEQVLTTDLTEAS